MILPSAFQDWKAVIEDTNLTDMSGRRKNPVTNHTCLNCDKPFSVKRNIANRFADIRYCGECKEAWHRNEYGGKRDGSARRNSRKSGTVSARAD